MSGDQRALSFVKFPRKGCRKKTQHHASERGPRRARAHPHMHKKKKTQQEAQNKERTEGTGKHSRGTMVRRSRGGVRGGLREKETHCASLARPAVSRQAGRPSKGDVATLPSPSRDIGQTQPATFSSFTVRRDDLPDTITAVSGLLLYWGGGGAAAAAAASAAASVPSAPPTTPTTLSKASWPPASSWTSVGGAAAGDCRRSDAKSCENSEVGS